MFVYCLFGSLWKSSLMSVVVCWHSVPNGNLRGIYNFSAIYLFIVYHHLPQSSWSKPEHV